LFVTETMHIDVIWAGIALGVAAGLEVPALILIGRLSLPLLQPPADRHRVRRRSSPTTSRWPTSPGLSMLIALQPLNAWCFAAIAGVGLTLFQQMIPRRGLPTGLYMNTRRVGAIVSGPIIALGSTTALGNRGIFLACGLLIVLALVVIEVAARQRGPHPAPGDREVDQAGADRREKSPRSTSNSPARRRSTVPSLSRSA
jgi:SET family sugar efflux transporter-like MFS transporter